MNTVEALLRPSNPRRVDPLVGTRTGLVRFDGRRGNGSRLLDGPRQSRFQTFASTRDRERRARALVGTDDGLGRLENSSGDCSHEAGLPNPIVRSLHAAPAPGGEPGGALVGTTGAGSR